jgi:MPBQ/MSBQ methyltransferase
MGSAVARLFDAMADSYDVLEPWYVHLYAALAAILRGELARPPDGRRRALDAGCGTGLQTALLDALGYASHGLDVSAGLLAVARRRLPSATFVLGSVEALPYPDRCFDVATCCGSTLSFVDAPARALRELGRVLRPGGRLLIECEHRWSLDLAWALLSSLTFDSLGYGVSPAAAWRQATRSPRAGVLSHYPGYGRLRLFTLPELEGMLRAAGLSPLRRWGLHSVTNVIPSTILHRDRLGRTLARLYRRLTLLDALLARCRPLHWMSNSLVILAQKADRRRSGSDRNRQRDAALASPDRAASARDLG